jgi:hypothetical protein
MTSDEEIGEIKKKLEDHERRIEDLENLVKSGRKRVLTKEKSILDHIIQLKSEGFFDQPKGLIEIVGKLAQVGYNYKPKFD